MANKELKQKYLDIIEEAQGADWRKYFKTETSLVVELNDNEELAGIDRHRITKSFCFDDSDDYEGALRMAEHARTSERYFIEQNLEPVRKEIDKLKFTDEIYLYKVDTWKDGNKGKIKGILSSRSRNEAATLLTPEERRKYIKGLEEELESFEKRINAYLKRYGLSKVRAWTYWGDR